MTRDQALLLTKGFLLGLADRLDAWAAQSLTGGWSTHQVAANLEAANDCRRIAAIIARAEQEEPAAPS